MYATFNTTSKGTWAYIQKSVRENGKPKTLTVKCLGLLSDIEREHGCADPRQWVLDLAARMTAEERQGRSMISVDYSPVKKVPVGEVPLRQGGDLLLLPLYGRLGLAEICRSIAKETRAKYDLDEILRTLVFGRLLFPASKSRTYEKARAMVRPPKFGEADMYRALSLLATRINGIQARVYANSTKFMERRSRIIYYDCTNYYFEIEDNDRDRVDTQTGEFVAGLRKRGKSKESRPNPIVQMGMFMDGDGIPLAFVVFPGNESEQTSLKPLEEVLGRKFGMTDFVVSTDAGLGAEDNRRYNMAEGRDYICVQSLPSLKASDRSAATDPRGWRLAYCGNDGRAAKLEAGYSCGGIFDLGELLQDQDKAKDMLRDTTFYKEILVDKTVTFENPAWTRAKKERPDDAATDAAGKRIPRNLKSTRQERVIVTYNHDFAIFLRHKRAERLAVANKIVASGKANPRRSQQSPLNYIEPVYRTADGLLPVKTELVIKNDVLEQEEALDGFYAYATSLDDEALLVLKARSFHHEIEHLFRTTKTHLGARPVFLTRQDRIKSHFLICFLALTILKMLQLQLNQPTPQDPLGTPVPVDQLIDTLRDIRFGRVKGRGYRPMFIRTALTDRLEQLCDIQISTEIITNKAMATNYQNVNKR